MRRVRQKGPKGQPSTTTASQVSTQTIAPLDDGSVTLAMIQALIPLGLRAVEDALQQEVRSLAGVRYAHDDVHPDVARWGSQPGSVSLADQKLPIEVPRVRDVAQSTKPA